MAVEWRRRFVSAESRPSLCCPCEALDPLAAARRPGRRLTPSARDACRWRLLELAGTLRSVTAVLDDPGSPAAKPKSGMRTPLWAGGALLLSLFVGLVGYRAGSQVNPAQVLHGMVYVGGGQASARVGTTFYSVPLSLPWRDAQGSWHEDGHPACLGGSGQSKPITFGAVRFKREGLQTRAVVWVECSR